MSLIEDMRIHIAVWWPLNSIESAGDAADEFGQPLHSDPVEVSCRWDEEAVQFIGRDGTTHVSRARVYVDRDMELGGVLMLGELVDITDPDNPRENVNAWEIEGWSKMADIDGTEFLRTAFL